MTAIAAASSTVNPSPVTAGSGRNERLHKAANQFEAMLLQEMLKPLAAKPADPESASGDGDNQSGPLQGFGVQAMAESLAHSGALGFAKQIEQALNKRTSEVPATK